MSVAMEEDMTKGEITMKMLKEKKANKLKVKKSTLMTVGMTIAMFSSRFVYADTEGASAIFGKAADMIREIIVEIVGISTAALVLVLAVALIMRMFADERSVTKWNGYAKRAVVSWVILNSLALFLSYGQNLVSEFSGELDQYLPEASE